MYKVTPKELREYKIFYEKQTYELLDRAADTIEELQNKIDDLEMELEYNNDWWQLIKIYF